MKKLKITLALIIVVCHLGYAQNFVKNPKKVDSILNILKNQPNDSSKVANLHYLFDYFVYKDLKKGKYYADEEIRVSKLLNYEVGIANGLYNYGVYYNNIGQLDSAIVYYKQAYELFEKKQNYGGMSKSNHGIAIIEQYRGNHDIALELTYKDIDLYRNKLPDSVRLGAAYDFISMIYDAKGNYKLAIINSLKAISILEKTDTPIRLADAFSHLGSNEFSLGNFEKSLEYKKKVLNIYKENDDNFYTTEAHNDIGIIYYHLKDYDKSIKSLKQGLALANEFKFINIKRTISDNLGKVFTATGDYSEAQKYLNEALKNADENNQDYWKPIILNNLGDLYNKTNRHEKAITFLTKAEEIGNNFNSLSTLKDSYFIRHESYLKLGQTERALIDYKTYTTLKDSLYNLEKIKEIEELRTIYDTEKKNNKLRFKKMRLSF
ncbi:tetratricopeptide repeat protein [Winogradskyella immobilis]|uniref:Tetratricopeptide repeat protein n=1 Tax=Winogradskyella immobilis TaxID=2816852 RepID=A0ABS8EQB4_9FLAO|nr:tetratricopeptide repeat protein [Winogradskyella immobilis]MCC1485401.1 tetratricopeptide repeat protein [Winogradskyella immobilis]MCG0017493.1 tetratricopeptide repeat protein [Winogradskyella immobilis]